MKKALLFLTLLSTSLFSITMSPLMQTVDSKKNKNMIFTVNNPTKNPVVVDFSATLLVSTDNNKEKKEETNKVTIYPSAFSIPSKGSQKVRVRYMGSSLPEIEEVYRIVATELDKNLVDEEDEQAGGKVSAQIKIRFSYSGLLFVREPNSSPKLEIVSFERIPTGGIKIDIKNSGKASAVPNANRYNFIIKIQNKLYKLTEDDLKKAEFRRVLAGKTNTFLLKNVQLPIGKIDSVVLNIK
jgi:P pilus assembly chaperone PapD